MYKTAKELIKIAKQILSYSGYMKPINKYMDKITDQVMKHVKDGKLQHNLLIQMGIKNPNQIKDKNQLYNYFTVSIYSPDIKNNKYEYRYFNCHKPHTNNMLCKCNYDQAFTNGNHIYLGVSAGLTKNEDRSFEELWDKYYEDTLQHELVHVFELFFGYKNKKLDYKNFDENEYDKSFDSFDEDNPELDFNWEVGYYYSHDVEFTPYLVNLISFFKNIYKSGVKKEQIVKMINNVNFNNTNDVKQFCNVFDEKGFHNDSPIKWFYHLNKKDKKLFNYAKKKLINAIMNF